MSLGSRVTNIFHTMLWGNSVALAWTWGIGLFFAVQVAIQFGFDALIKFATIDALGLTLFGVVNAYLARNCSAQEYEVSFLDKAKNFKFAFLLYQFLAITLTIFCCLKYVSLPLGVLSVLVGGMFFGATIFLGEEFKISRIKYSHGVYGFVIFTALTVLANSNLFSSAALISAGLTNSDQGLTAQLAINPDLFSWIKESMQFEALYSFKSPLSMFALWLPIFFGFLCGPWLDLQNWQRVIQIKKEGLSVSASYVIGGLLFWAILVLDGSIALACYRHAREFFPELLSGLSNIDSNSLFYSVKSIITNVLSVQPSFDYLLGFYIVFIALAALSTFDSGYIAYKWYSESLLKDNDNILFSFLPVKAISSPVLGFLVCVVTATVSLHFSELGKFVARFDPSLDKFFRFELEYYLAFYASFFIIYAVTFYRNIADAKHRKTFSGLKLFATALSSIAAFGIGYFSENTLVMALGSLVPFVYGWYMISKEQDYQPQVEATPATLITTQAAPDSPQLVAQSNAVMIDLPSGAKPVGIKGCYAQDGWFVHSFIPTYQDTNSVGNVYFAMYAMWVGKTRELFFLHTMPDFDLETTSFFILTRNFEHKFLKEIKEFTEVKIKIKIGDFNRKFVTLEHMILDAQDDVIGKGKQSLMFVDSKTYGLIDIPHKVQFAFMDYVEDRAKLAGLTHSRHPGV